MQDNLTPMMKQYVETKKKYPEGILLFRAGDFYEMFYDDAKIASEILNITLTKRGSEKINVPLAGIPFHSIDPYIAKLVKAGKKVVICEQTENPKKAKGLVKREVTRVITPSTLFSQNYENNFLCSITYLNSSFGFSIIDITTGEFKATNFTNLSTLLNELNSIKPKELLLTKNILKNYKLYDEIKKTLPNTIINYTQNLDLNNSLENLKKHFNLSSLEGFGISKNPEIIISCNNALVYLKETQFSKLEYIKVITRYSSKKYLMLDRKTIRNLELVSNLQDNTIKYSLFYLINNTKTAMGYRKLFFDITHPLLEREEIKQRLDAIEYLKDNLVYFQSINENLSYISDIERIISKVGFNNASPRDLVSLRQSLDIIPEIKFILKKTDNKLLQEIDKNLEDVKDLRELLHKSIVDQPPFSVREGKFIKVDYNKELNELINIHKTIDSWITEYEYKLKNELNIKSLKLKFNKIFGYYIEIPKTYTSKVPDYFEKKQTLVNAERYTTKELSQKEETLINAKEKRFDLEFQIFTDICKDVLNYQSTIQNISKYLGFLDLIISHTNTSITNNYNKPNLKETNRLYFKDLRHPIIEKQTEFIPNDCDLDNENRTMIITGPNMSGKSSYMRSVCLSIILTHTGCFIPVNDSEIGYIDGVFTRVGASDDILHGQSTFLVEMS
ncbi:DNA mismatch repair protein MutS [Candidatus Vampirococcus lugosii]|uniref:DNA mismatch repair protein MutS n=1 Tax=Candidatus Vampirococcus lugosii TaxID=2789015 RepID=A0ABS5QLW7_9BACT|nr:DNA mismatch repair protein MutS [Candidatus Vampirococcus lugosii]MBS8122192.1 DNA mismatch repair protein MutS [Candidatus Vampirococcus lugosii]